MTPPLHTLHMHNNNGTLSSNSSSRRSSLAPYPYSNGVGSSGVGSGAGGAGGAGLSGKKLSSTSTSSSVSGLLYSDSTSPRSTWSTPHTSTTTNTTSTSNATCIPIPSSSSPSLSTNLLSSSTSNLNPAASLSGFTACSHQASSDLWKSRLRTRARVTNLGVLLLVGLTGLSILCNLIQLNQHRSRWMVDHSYHHSIKALENSQSLILSPPAAAAPPSLLSSSSSSSSLKPTKTTANSLTSATFNYSSLNHLVLVPCHAVYIGTDVHKVYDDSEWMLEWYQRDQGSAKAWIVHIEQGIEELVKDEHSLLIYSGGQTKSTQLPFPISESSSYAKLAHTLNLYSKIHQAWLLEQKSSGLGSTSVQQDQNVVTDDERAVDMSSLTTSLLSRVTTEEFSLDSFQNVLFSIARFREMTGHYPSKITMTGYSFKSHRFLQLHIPSLKLKPNMFTYRGYDGNEMIDERYKGERKVVESFERDRYGCQQVIQRKRRSRNESHRVHGYLWSAPEIKGLLEWCPSDGVSLYPGKVPW